VQDASSNKKVRVESLRYGCGGILNFLLFILEETKCLINVYEMTMRFLFKWEQSADYDVKDSMLCFIRPLMNIANH